MLHRFPPVNDITSLHPLIRRVVSVEVVGIIHKILGLVALQVSVRSIGLIDCVREVFLVRVSCTV